MKKNEKGSTLVYAIVIISLLLIVIAAAMSISYSYYNRSLVNNRKRQAYLTAKTVITTVSEGIMNKNDFIDIVPVPPKQTKSKFEVDENFPKDMGTIDKAGMTINIKKDTTSGIEIEKYVLTVYVQATYEGQTTIINADFERDKENADINTWKFLKYYEGDIIESYNIQIAKELLENIGFIYEKQEEIFYATTGKDKLKKDFAEMMNQLIKDSGITTDLIFKDTNATNNDFLRRYVYEIIQNSLPKTLDINELVLPDNMKAYYESLYAQPENGTNRLYIHVMFGYQGGSTGEKVMIYANTSKVTDSGGDRWRPTFVYLPETNHWYYNPESPGSKVSKFPYIDQMNNANKEIAEATYNNIIKLCTDDHIAQ